MGRLATVIDATAAALRDPRDTAQVFRISEALSFGTPERLLEQLRRQPDGPSLIARRDDLVEALGDRETLAALPKASLGAAYLEFVDAEGITAEGLIEASMVLSDGQAPEGDLAFIRRRMRDSHDLWHAVTGYRGDLLGETALLAFTFAQTRHPGVGFLVGVGMVLAAGAGHRSFIAGGYRRGRRARPLVGVDWVRWLPRPLAEVRAELGIDPQRPYVEVREPQLPAPVKRWIAR